MPKVVQRRRRSLDTETTGKDLRHGCMPFFVTSYDGDKVSYWEWDVDPLTRLPRIVKGDWFEVMALIDDPLGPNSELILQNPKFDVTAINAAMDTKFWGWDDTLKSNRIEWPWERTWDTLLAGHLLASNQPHDLTTMSLVHLGVNIKPLEDALKEACNQARRLARSKYPAWRIAREDDPMLPSCKSESKEKADDGTPRSTPWANDMWLPRAVAKAEGYAEDHPWWNVLRDYSNADSEVTYHLFEVQEALLKQRGLWEIYLERLKILPVLHDMEASGVTLNEGRLKEKRKEYSEVLAESQTICLNIADSYNYDLALPKGAINNSLYNFVFSESGLNLKSNNFTDTGKYKFDKYAVDDFLLTLDRRSKPFKFIQKLKDSRNCSTALGYMESYEKYWVGEGDWKVIYPSVNPTGTDTLRMASADPNEQQISKKEGFNLRYLFGPLPGWEWWSLDYENLELRIPAYESNEQAMIELFERPDEAPYFGSNHLLFAHLIHDNDCTCNGCTPLRESVGLGLFEEACRTENGLDGRLFKKKHPSTWYQWTKNGDFAVQYSAVATSGTADRAYHVPGAQLKIESKLGNIAVLNEQQKSKANRLGYVETIPDKEVNPNKGYPLLCHRGSHGRVKPTLPLSYHVQGTACWIMMRAMIKVAAYLKSLGDGSRMIMNVHDEIVVAMPKRENKGNLPRIDKVRSLMAQVGDCVGIPLTVGVSYCPNNWAEAV